MSKNLGVVFCTALLLSSTAAIAKDRGAYVSAATGVNLMGDSDLDNNTVNTDIDFDEGFAGALALGYRYGNGIRSEIEANYLNNDVNSITGAATPTGNVDSLSFMLNMLYDFNTNSRFTPYIGAGAGVAMVDFDGVNPVNGSRVSDSDEIAVAQGIVGLSYDINESLEFFGAYKYLAALGDSPEVTTNSGVKLEGDHENNVFLIGLRYSFGSPKTIPAPVEEPITFKPVAEPEVKYFPKVVKEVKPEPKKIVSRSYLAFFDFDKFDITPDATKILDKVIEDSSKGVLSKIEVTGHADRVGTDEYNMKLSMKRAKAVKAYLMKNGMKENDISLFAKGETDLAVPTEDGVREPQNRRATIIYTLK